MTNNVIDLTTAQRIDARREVRRLSSIEARRTLERIADDKPALVLAYITRHPSTEPDGAA